MFNRFMKWLVPKLEERCLRTGRFCIITGTSGPDEVYLRRMFLFRSKLFSVYIHRFMRSDKDDHHDHPFDFVGYVVSKGYTESVLTGKHDCLYLCGGRSADLEHIYDGTFTVSRRREGTWGFRAAEAKHMVILDRSYSNEEYKEAPLTVIFRGPYRREWGFWKPTGFKREFEWIEWWTYLGVPKGDIRE